MNCEFCEKTFSTKSNLKIHQTKAKYCLLLQGKHIAVSFPCKMCDRKFGLKHHLNEHLQTHDKEDTRLYIENQDLRLRITELELRNNVLDTSLAYSQDTVSKLEKQVSEFMRSMERVASKPNTTNNNNIVNVGSFQPITHAMISEASPSLTIEDVSEPDGMGYALFAEKLYKDKLACTDYARSILKWKSEEDIVSDPKGVRLWKEFCKGISVRNEELYKEVINNINNSTGRDPEEFMLEMCKHADNICAVRGGERGETSELQRIWVEHLCRAYKK